MTTYGVLATAWRPPSVNQQWCSHMGGLGPPFPFCPVCESKSTRFLARRERVLAMAHGIEELIDHQLHDSAKYTRAREVRRAALFELVEKFAE